MEYGEHLDLAVGHLDAAAEHLRLEKSQVSRKQEEESNDAVQRHMVDRKGRISGDIEVLEQVITALKRRFEVVREG